MIKAPNTVCIPHLAASTPESEDNCAVMAVSEISDYIEKGIIKNSVNYPDMELPAADGSYLLALHKNIPNMISSIANAFSSLGVNIENMTNRSKKDYACTLVHIVGEVSGEVVDSILAIDGVIKVRVI